jgi:hypothetical protein
MMQSVDPCCDAAEDQLGQQVEHPLEDMVEEPVEDPAEDPVEDPVEEGVTLWTYVAPVIQYAVGAFYHVLPTIQRVSNNITRSPPVCVATTAAACGVFQAILLLRLVDCWFDDTVVGREWTWCFLPIDSICGIIVMLDGQTGCISGIAYAFWFCRLLVACIDDMRSCGLAEVAWICGVAGISTSLRYALPPDGTSHVPMGMLMLAY